jgi:hypothetical protein
MKRGTFNGRAGCGKSARPVRREGERQLVLPTPIITSLGDVMQKPGNVLNVHPLTDARYLAGERPWIFLKIRLK